MKRALIVLGSGWSPCAMGRQLLALLIALLLAVPTVEASTIREVEKILEELERALKKRSSDSGELAHYLEEGAHLMGELTPPPRPALTGDAVKDKNGLKTWARARDVFAKRKQRLEEGWLELLGRALTLYKPHRNSETNQRLDVNLTALAILRDMGGADAARSIVRGAAVLARQRVFDTRYAMSEHFAALARLKSPEALDAMRAVFVGKHAQWIQKLALDTMLEPSSAPGSVRLAVVRDVLAAYVDWEQSPPPMAGLPGPGAILEAARKVVQVHAKNPKDNAGKPLGTLTLLAEWFRQHQDLTKAPWKD